MVCTCKQIDNRKKLILNLLHHTGNKIPCCIFIVEWLLSMVSVNLHLYATKKIMSFLYNHGRRVWRMETSLQSDLRETNIYQTKWRLLTILPWPWHWLVPLSFLKQNQSMPNYQQFYSLNMLLKLVQNDQILQVASIECAKTIQLIICRYSESYKSSRC